MTAAEIQAKIDKLNNNKFIPDDLKKKQITKLNADLARLGEKTTSTKEPSSKAARKKKPSAGGSADPFESFDIDTLDPLERQQYDDVIKRKSKKGALQAIIDGVEGDLSQLSPALKKLTKAAKSNKKNYSTSELEQMLADEIEESGANVYTDRRKTLEEMIKMRKNASGAEKKPTPAYKGTPLKELNEENCRELLAEVEQRRKSAKASAKRSKSKPVIEKIAGSVVSAAIKAVKNVSVEEIKDDPKKELGRMDQLLVATRKYLGELKTILGDDFDAETVSEEIKPLMDLVKELRKKYGE